jgi:hypothetical protein
MIQLILAALFFMALHVGVSGTSVRGQAIEKLGEKATVQHFPCFP